MSCTKIIGDKKFIAADWAKTRIMAEDLSRGISAETNRETRIVHEKNPFRSADNYGKIGYTVYKEARMGDLC
jgi:hypothetical protein